MDLDSEDPVPPATAALFTNTPTVAATQTSAAVPAAAALFTDTATVAAAQTSSAVPVAEQLEIDDVDLRETLPMDTVTTTVTVCPNDSDGLAVPSINIEPIGMQTECTNVTENNAMDRDEISEILNVEDPELKGSYIGPGDLAGTTSL